MDTIENRVQIGSSLYETNRADYIKKRGEIIKAIKAEGANDNTVGILTNNTNEWLQKLDDILSGSKMNKDVDTSLTHLLQFATSNNTCSLSKIADQIEGCSEQDLKYLFNEHVRQISDDIRNTFPNVDKLPKENYDKAAHKR